LLHGNDPDFRSSPDEYFKLFSAEVCLSELKVVFKANDCFTKEVYSFEILGQKMMQWLPRNYEIDLKTKFRRKKFGLYLLQFISLRFVDEKNCELFLIKENIVGHDYDYEKEKVLCF
jgi:hypothetical protein